MVLLVLAFGCDPTPAAGQHTAHQHESAPPGGGWRWMTDANVFAGYNYQRRQFLDYSAWESQNWFMAHGVRAAGTGEIAIEAMATLEPFTIARRGSPQLFQTGESYQGIPLVNYQHPHDLVMGLGATYRVAHRGLRYTVGADLVGSPTLGPTPFMHRASARNNPQVPILHHFLDSTHITPGVVRVSVGFGGFTLESSVFRGREPDDNRLDIDAPALDSWAVRGQYAHGSWTAQISGGRMRQPEWWEPFDASRITASIGFDGMVRGRPTSMLVAWGGNREFNGFNGNHDGLLVEADVSTTRVSSVYGRYELAQKEILGQEFHPPGQPPAHPHFFSLVTVATAGYVRDLPAARVGRLGVGADIVFYRMPQALEPLWKGSRSFHVFLRWRPSASHENASHESLHENTKVTKSRIPEKRSS